MHEHFSEKTLLSNGFSIRPLDPSNDSHTVFLWTREEHGQFWGMRDKTETDIADIYQWLADSQTHHAYMVTLDDRDIAVFQTYDPKHDEVGEHIETHDGDLGIHLMMAPRDSKWDYPNLTTAALTALVPAVLQKTKARRIIAEPDAANERAIQRLVSAGFTLGEVVHLEQAQKDAQLAFLDVAKISFA